MKSLSSLVMWDGDWRVGSQEGKEERFNAEGNGVERVEDVEDGGTGRKRKVRTKCVNSPD